jgi:GntR family transcriptional regulator
VALIDLGQTRQARPASKVLASSDKALLYEQVIELVEELVVERRLSPGDLLPTQAELGKLAGVSRITVTRALAELEREGKVRRHQGVGTFLSQPRIVSEPARTGSLLGTLSSAVSDLRLTNRVLSLTQGLPSADLAQVLDLSRRARVWQLRRVRLLEGRAIVAETSIIPVALAPDLDGYRDALSGSLYELLEQNFSLKDVSEEQYLEVASPTAEHRRLLSLSAQASVVRIRGLSSDTSGRPFDCFEQVYPSTDFVFYLSGGETRQLLVSSATKDWSVGQIEDRQKSAKAAPVIAAAKKRATKKS